MCQATQAVVVQAPRVAPVPNQTCAKTQAAVGKIQVIQLDYGFAIHSVLVTVLCWIEVGPGIGPGIGLINNTGSICK